MQVETIIQALSSRGIQLYPEGDKLAVEPASRLTDADRAVIRAQKADILRPCTADAALTLLNRLKGYTVPTGRMPVVRELAERLAPFAHTSDPAAILGVLRDFERELIALGGTPDPALAEAVAMVETVFPGARLIEVKKRA